MSKETNTVEQTASERIEEKLDQVGEKFAGELGRVAIATDEIRTENEDLKSRVIDLETRLRERVVRGPDAPDDKPKPISLRRLIGAMRSGDWQDAGYEREVCTENQERALAAGIDSAGGYIVPQEHLPEQFIELIRANSIMDQLPTTPLNNLTSSPIDMSEQTGAATAYWTAENAAITASSQTFGKRTLEPHGLKGLVPMSNRILRMSDPSAENIVQADLAAVLGLELSRAFIYGSGASGEPIGVYNTTGITSQTSAATISPALMWDMISLVELADVPVDASAAFCLNPARWNTLRQSSAVVQAGINRTTGGVAPMIAKDLGGIPIFTSTQITTAQALFGVWRHALIGRWGGLEIAASPHRLFNYDMTEIRAVMDVDFLFRRPAAFCRETNFSA